MCKIGFRIISLWLNPENLNHSHICGVLQKSCQNEQKTRLNFFSLFCPFCLSWKPASQTVVWSKWCESQRGSEGDEALSLTASLSLTYREWEECKPMSKIITLSMALIPMNVCAVSDCLPPTALEWEPGKRRRRRGSSTTAPYTAPYRTLYRTPYSKNTEDRLSQSTVALHY